MADFIQPVAGPELGQQAAMTEQTVGAMDRRGFLRKGSAFAAAVGFFGVKELFRPESAVAQQQEEHAPENSLEGHSNPLEGEHHVEDHEAEEGITAANWKSALMVGITFGKQVWNNVMYERTHDRPEGERRGRPFGLRSFINMGVAEGFRLLWIKDRDPHQYEHEVKDLAQSVGLGTVLVGMAELTEHGEADEVSVFDRKVKTIADALKAQKETEDQEPPMPDRFASAETWRSYAQHKRKSVVEIVGQNTALGTVLAPLATTYTSASLINTRTDELAESLVDLKYAEAMAGVRDMSEVSDAQEVELFTKAMEETEEAMNGADGYVRMELALAANIKGAGLWGDPPNLFYWLKNKTAEWLKTSKWGLVGAAGMTVAMNRHWLKKHAGVSGGERLRHYAETVHKSGRVVKEMGRGLGLVDQSFLRHRRFSNRLYEGLSEMKADQVGDTGFTDEQLEDLRGMLGGMRRSPFALFDGVKKAFTGLRFEEHTKEEWNLGRTLHDFRLNPEARGADVELADLHEMLRNSTTQDVTLSIMRNYGTRHHSRTAEQISDVFSRLVKNEFTEDDKEFLDKLNIATDGVDGIEQHSELLDEITEAIHSDRIQDFDQLLDEFEAKLPILPDDVKQALKFFWAKQVDADLVDHRTREGGLSHSAKEVMAALSTQILAANSLAVLAKKFLEEVGGNMPSAVQNTMVLGLASAVSGVADNVVAYLFAQDVLQEVYKKRYGEDVFEQPGGEELRWAVNSSALYCAVAGGALTRIGNGPGLKFELIELEKETGQLKAKAKHKQLKLDESAKNKYSAVASASTITASVTNIYAAEKQFALAA